MGTFNHAKRWAGLGPWACFVGLSAVAPLLMVAMSVQPALGQDRAVQAGERLAFECLTCHRRDGRDLGIPGIVAMSEADIVTALTLYKTGLRQNRVMVSVAAGLNQGQMEAVARYLSALGKR